MEEKVRDEREIRRIVKAVDDFRLHLLCHDEAFRAHSPPLPSPPHPAAVPSPSSSSYRIEAFPHKRLLPNTLVTALALHFSLLPGSQVVTDILRFLATKIILKQIEPTISVFELIEMIQQEGGLEVWRALPKHKLID